MTPAEFAANCQRLGDIAERVAEYELEPLLATIARTRSAAMLLPPAEYSVWLQHEAALDQVERLAKALKSFRDEVFRQLRRRAAA